MLRRAKVPDLPAVPSDAVLVTAHLFYPLFLKQVPKVKEPHVAGSFDFLPRLGQLPSQSSLAVVHGFPFDVVVLHETHDLAEFDLPGIAAWRRDQIARCKQATAEHFKKLGVRVVALDHDPYCFTVFVVNGVPWPDEQLQNRATHILAMPNVLLTGGNGESAEERAATVLYSASQINDVIDFSLTGSHYGAASWAAVAVLPTDEFSEVADALVELEIQLQAFWCYASNVEARGAFANDAFDAKFLRRVLSKLQRPAATEHTAVRRLREALLHTSRIADLVASAIEATTKL